MTAALLSYSSISLISLRAHALTSQDIASAEALNLWKPTAAHNTRGETQPFPFKDYPHGVTGTINTSAAHIDSIFDDSMSNWDTPADDSAWGDAAAQPIIAVTSEVTLDAADAAQLIAEDEGIVEPAPPAAEIRKSSLVDLTNGSREAVTAHLAQGLGPHQLLPRFASEKSAPTSPTSPTEPNVVASLDEPDGAASAVDTVSSSSVTSPLSTRKPAPHRKLQVMAQEAPLPESPAPVAPAVTIEPASIAPAVTIEPAIVNDDSRSSSIVIVEPITDQLDPKADEWVPDVTVELLPPSCPVSPTSKVPIPDGKALILTTCREAECILICDPVPKSWSVPTVVSSLSDGDFYDDPVIGGVHQKLLCNYSQYFAAASDAESTDGDAERDQIVSSPSWAVFRQWVYTHKHHAKSANGMQTNILSNDLKTLVQLWRFAARIQAPLFANTIADVLISKVITADDLFEAAEEIDNLLMIVSSTSRFRLLISHVVILNGIQLDYQDYFKWPRSLLWSILAWLSMGKSTYVGTQMYSQANPCVYHLHTLGHSCNS